MGQRRNRLIVQADLTSEEDEAFLAWVNEKLRRRRLAEEIRVGLRLQYEQTTGQAGTAYPSYLREVQQSVPVPQLPQDYQEEASSVNDKLQKLVRRF